MPSNAYRDRLFPPREVRRILQRAAELEEAARPPREAGRAHTLEEIERIAGDAGISEDALRRALAGETKPEAAPRHPWSLAGAPGRVSVEKTVRGSANAENHAKLTKAMRSATGELGNAQAIGDSLSWSASTPGGRSIYAIVEPEGDGRVTVRVDENLRGLRGGLYGGIMGGGGGGGSALVVSLVAAVWPGGIGLVLVAWFAFMYLLARTIYANRFRAREAELRTLVDNVAALVEAQGPRVASSTAPAAAARIAATAPTQELPAEDDPDEERRAPGRRAGM
ncbi:MAG: hypothetical protein ACLQBL_29370 [Polyangiaceae bacterium]|jgi:hypothetical protein